FEAFFYSSRRRHTSFSRDWSSDVCSSDLNAFLDGELVEASGFTALIHENLFPLAGSPLAERGRSVAGVNRKRCIKRMCHCRYIRVAEHAPDLGIVDTRSAAGMEVDTIIDLRH